MRPIVKKIVQESEVGHTVEVFHSRASSPAIPIDYLRGGACLPGCTFLYFVRSLILNNPADIQIIQGISKQSSTGTSKHFREFVGS